MSEESNVRVKQTVIKKRRVVSQKRDIPADEFMAASIGDAEWLDISLSNRSPTAMDRNGLTPLHLAAMHGHLSCIQLLVEKYHVDVNLSSMSGWTALHLVINKENGSKVQKCVKYLLEQGSDVNATNDDYTTPLHQASAEGSVSSINLLLKAGAKVEAEDKRGHTPFDLAKLWCQKKCARAIQTEIWNAEKHTKAKDVKTLHSAKRKYLGMQDEAMHQLRNEKEFYGNVAYENWLADKGINPITIPKERYPNSRAAGLERRLRRQGDGGMVGSRLTDDVSPSREQMNAYMMQQEALYKRRPPSGRKDPKRQYFIDWNPSTNVESIPVTNIKNREIVGISVHPDDIKTIIANNAHLPVRLDLQNDPKIQVMTPGGKVRTADINVPELSKDTILRVMRDQKGRIKIPQEFKAIHISDVDKKRRTTSAYQSEIGMHLNVYGNSWLSKKNASTTSFDQENRERMIRTLENMSKKQSFLA